MDSSQNVVNPIPINPKSALISLTDFEKTVNSQHHNGLNVLPIFASPQALLAGYLLLRSQQLIYRRNLIPFNFANPSSISHGIIPPVSASPPPRRLKKTTVFWDFGMCMNKRILT
jgi:hypothetical protein